MKRTSSLFSDALLIASAPLVILFLQIVRMNLAPEAYYFDVLAHFFGGSAIAIATIIAWNAAMRRKWIGSSDACVRTYVIATSGLVIGVIWEWWEFWMERWTGNIYQPTMGDTMQDLFMDLIGGILIMLILRLMKKRA